MSQANQQEKSQEESQVEDVKEDQVGEVQKNEVDVEIPKRVDRASEFVPPHKTISRLVEDKDLPRVIEDAKKMIELCHAQVGAYPAGFAVAHPQITSEDPLRFYATYDGSIIVNPEIVRHSNYKTSEIEGCLTFGSTMPIKKDRWRIVEMEYNEIETNGEGESRIGVRKHVRLTGLEARIVQHETDHLDGVYLYDVFNIPEETKELTT